LKSPNKPVENFNDPVIKQVIEDLTESMRAGGLIGMAAPQTGENYMVFVTEPRETKFRPAAQADELRVYINPIMVEVSLEEVIIYEGCGCVANVQDFGPVIFGPVKRPKEITIEAYDQNGRKFRLRCNGILARVIQHEYDHLWGIEFVEKIFDYGRLVSLPFYVANIKNSQEQVEASLVTIKEYQSF